MTGKRLVLASASPRRLDLLRQMGIEPEVFPVDAMEKMSGLPPEELVLTNAYSKAKLAAGQKENVWIVAADTIVVLDNKVIGKPQSPEEAIHMLQDLSGTMHSVYTGIYIVSPDRKTLEDVAETRVWFRRLQKEEIIKYVATGEPMDKAGAYGIQGLGAIFIEGIEGDYNNVVGLPISRVYTLLQVLGYYDN